jgi:lipid A 3-O-deacylase
LPKSTPVLLGRITALALAAAVLCGQAGAQAASSSVSENAAPSPGLTADPIHDPVESIMSQRPWEYGAFVNGGLGTNSRDNYKFFDVGLHAGKVLFAPAGPGWLRGQFEYGVEIIPLWQAYTPRFQRANCAQINPATVLCGGLYNTGGTYTGVSITPIILRWNLRMAHRWMPWVQGAGGVIWTNHKFPPVGPYPFPGHQGTSVFNFTPQFGIGVHYFLRPRQSISFSANAVHISNASLGDANPGVNASVQLSVGYTWWK